MRSRPERRHDAPVLRDELGAIGYITILRRNFGFDGEPQFQDVFRRDDVGPPGKIVNKHRKKIEHGGRIVAGSFQSQDRGFGGLPLRFLPLFAPGNQ